MEHINKVWAQAKAHPKIAIAVAVVAAGLAGLNPPGFVAQVVALAFGLAASSFFPAIILLTIPLGLAQSQ